MKKEKMSKEKIKKGLRKLAGGSPAKDRKDSLTGILGFHRTSFLTIKCHVMPLGNSTGSDITLDLEDISNELWEAIYTDKFDNYDLYDYIQAKTYYEDFIEIYSDIKKILNFNVSRNIFPDLFRNEIINPEKLYKKLSPIAQEWLKDFLPKAKKNYKKAIDLKSETKNNNISETKEEKIKSISGLVYLLKIKNKQQYKIGVTTDMDKRVKQISPKMPFELEIEHKIKHDDIYGLEDKLHNKFNDKRIKGEWFELDEKDVEYIKSL